MATHKVRVRRGPLSGFAAGGARLSIVPGEYDVEHVGNSLIFKRADQRKGGDVLVDLAEYLEIGDFPNVLLHTQIEIV